MVVKGFKDFFAKGPRLEMIRHDIPERDREWFANCRMHHLEQFPWITSDLVRTGMALWLIASAPLHAFLTVAALTGSLFVLECVLYSNIMRIAPETMRRLNMLRVLLLVRGCIWSLAIGIAVAAAPANGSGQAIFFGAAVVMIDTIFMTSLPLVGLGSNLAVMLAIGMALIRAKDVDPWLAAAMTLMMAMGVHYAIFSLYHLFATRRLRTRRLKTANETIEVLLSHYDQHGSDWLVEIDRDGRLERPSARMCAALGRDVEAVEGMHITSLLEPGPQWRELIRSAQALRQISNLTLPARFGDERRWWSISGCPVFDGEGNHTGYRAFVQDVTERHTAEERVRTMALTDALTGLANRPVFTARLSETLEACDKGEVCGVLFIDLDSFKATNDTFGHAAGDEVLRQTAERIAALARPGDTAARLGGDEFALLVTSAETAHDLVSRAEALVSALSRPMHVDGKTMPGGASVGVALGPRDGANGESLLRAADLALYEAKSRGRSCHVEYQPALLEERAERRRMECDLRHALERDEFEIHYQPLIDIATRQTKGYEALLRWNHPTRGSVPPSVFIPLAEDLDLINTIGTWVLREALAEAATWDENLTIAVNVSPAQMRGEALLGQVIGALAASGVAPERLELEITENLLVHECEVHTRLLHRLRAFGARIALDDFGTGYSSLNYLRSFPFDKLKIDRSFVRDLTCDGDSLSIVEMLLRLARDFSMETIVEGVENEGQFAALTAMGCDQVQGFLFGRPIPASELPPEIRKPVDAAPSLASEPIEWLRQRGCGALPRDTGYCQVSCRKC
ncbi:hypothetical protein B2G71_07530 [Novosphingobium sp. PC22D]|uniref:putative bifunctional diguanylate cyclase/phosphodiesterase n=1 Tax=Novosphingobium sp. PC22D TaxID=1962403 RepID=UPI000BF06089|nr:EAL domain-containing protein [Novosphingobium sp. PC22D]PEQ13279.1 hypothetical protein B2G71_07530 [Novosphingobium sp. PC22D]